VEEGRVFTPRDWLRIYLKASKDCGLTDMIQKGKRNYVLIHECEKKYIQSKGFFCKCGRCFYDAVDLLSHLEDMKKRNYKIKLK